VRCWDVSLVVWCGCCVSCVRRRTCALCLATRRVVGCWPLVVVVVVDKIPARSGRKILNSLDPNGSLVLHNKNTHLSQRLYVTIYHFGLSHCRGAAKSLVQKRRWLTHPLMRDHAAILLVHTCTSRTGAVTVKRGALLHSFKSSIGHPQTSHRHAQPASVWTLALLAYLHTHTHTHACMHAFMTHVQSTTNAHRHNTRNNNILYYTTRL
jgi:hypothetical protein